MRAHSTKDIEKFHWFTALLPEPFLEPQMHMNLVFLIFLLVSLVRISTKSILFGPKVLNPQIDESTKEAFSKYVIEHDNSVTFSWSAVY